MRRTNEGERAGIDAKLNNIAHGVERKGFLHFDVRGEEDMSPGEAEERPLELGQHALAQREFSNFIFRGLALTAFADFGMSDVAANEEVVQRLDEEREELDFIAEDDALEVIEMEEVGEDMDDSDGEPGLEDEMDEDNEIAPEEMDGAEQLLASGFDDSITTYSGHDSPIFTIALHPVDPTIAISGGEDDLGHIWRTDTGETIALLDGHTDSVTSVGFSFEGDMVATGGMDGLVRVWRKVKDSVGFLSWEFLLQLEGPDEVNVSSSFPFVVLS